MEIASAKNTFPIYHSAIPPLYMWSIKVRNLGFIKENFWFGHFHEFCDNATGSERLGPKVSVINAYTMHMCICDRYWQIRYSISKTWIHRIQYFVSAAGVGGRGCAQTVSSQLIGFSQLKAPKPLAPSILSLAALPTPYSKPS